MQTREDALEAIIEKLREENRLLRKTLKIQKEQMRGGNMMGELRRLRAKIAEWEGSMMLFNGGYHHGDRFIRPFLDREEGL